MAGRRVVTIEIAREGSRDNGGIFVLTEMPAIPATDLCLQTMQMVARGGVDIPPHILTMGGLGIVTMGAGAVLAGLGKTPWYEVKPLLQALLTCVTSYQPPGAARAQTDWRIIETQIEEPSTILQLYEEVVSLHLGFSLADRLSNYREVMMKLIAVFTPSTETSAGTSPLSSAPDSPP